MTVTADAPMIPVRALNQVQPYDWAAFLHARLDAVEPAAPLDGIKRGGYRLVYTDVESDFVKSNEKDRKIVLAIEKRDPDQAEQAARAHIRNAQLTRFSRGFVDAPRALERV